MATIRCNALRLLHLTKPLRWPTDPPQGLGESFGVSVVASCSTRVSPFLRTTRTRLFRIIPFWGRVLALTLLVFALVHLAPGDPISAIVPPDAPKEVVDKLKEYYGFDQPLPVQYLRWLGVTLTGDLGTSIGTGRSVASEVGSAFGNTIILAIAAVSLTGEIPDGLPASSTDMQPSPLPRSILFR